MTYHWENVLIVWLIVIAACSFGVILWHYIKFIRRIEDKYGTANAVCVFLFTFIVAVGFGSGFLP